MVFFVALFMRIANSECNNSSYNTMINNIKEDNSRLDDDAEDIITTIIRALFSPKYYITLYNF